MHATPGHLEHPYRTHRDEVVHLSRVEEVEDLNLVQDHGGSGNERRTTHVPVGVLGLEQEAREFSFPHGGLIERAASFDVGLAVAASSGDVTGCGSRGGGAQLWAARGGQNPRKVEQNPVSVCADDP
ncbi:hypothetical protein EYF80_042297 [Liparis tanakae]|uniref:Uncharacterized protein n=1 Tax=Liparis tanakae TaxID=230148 RepID=A0A4Z2G2X2_9TELE|nr:hypothetical protein EYF80_042297 [Liparis tanakae]